MLTLSNLPRELRLLAESLDEERYGREKHLLSSLADQAWEALGPDDSDLLRLTAFSLRSLADQSRLDVNSLALVQRAAALLEEEAELGMRELTDLIEQRD